MKSNAAKIAAIAAAAFMGCGVPDVPAEVYGFSAFHDFGPARTERVAVLPRSTLREERAARNRRQRRVLDALARRAQ